MDKKKILSNLSIAFLAQGVSMLLSVLQTLLVPKVLGIREFSYWQLFLFYSSYVGFFHFGLSSGVYLENGGISRNQIDKSSLKSQFIFGVLFESVIAIGIASFAWGNISDVDRLFVIIQVAIVMVLKNAAVYMMNVLQCMNETSKSSLSTIAERLAFLVPLTVLMLLHVDEYELYIISFVIAAVVQVVFCAWHLRDFVNARWKGLRLAARLSGHSISVGINLMLANIASMLILGVAREIVDIRWGIETFGRLSLVMSIVSFFLAFVNQAGLVLFPALRQGEDAEVRSFYIAARDALALAFPLVYLLYFPMMQILVIWLPAYADAFTYLVLLLPICVFDSKMSITGTTYFNVLRKERAMLILNVGSAALSIALALISAFVLNAPFAVIASMSFVIMIRSILAEWYLSKQIGVKGTSLTLWEVLLTILFIGVTQATPAYIAFAIYFALYSVYLIVHRNVLLETVSRITG